MFKYREPNSLQYLHRQVTIYLDRPMGSKHPKHGFFYPVNYGYIPGILSGDGEELDAYLLGVFHPVIEYTGVCIAVVHRLEEDDDKLIVVPRGVSYTPPQILALTEFQERYFETEIITRSRSNALLHRFMKWFTRNIFPQTS